MKKIALLLLPVAVVAGEAWASTAGTTGTTGNTDFQDVYDTLGQWSQGNLGKTLGVASLLVGLGIGVIKQSVMAAVVGVAMSLVAAYGPDTVDGIVSAGMAVTVPI